MIRECSQGASTSIRVAGEFSRDQRARVDAINDQSSLLPHMSQNRNRLQVCRHLLDKPEKQTDAYQVAENRDENQQLGHVLRFDATQRAQSEGVGKDEDAHAHFHAAQRKDEGDDPRGELAGGQLHGQEEGRHGKDDESEHR